MHKAKPSRKSDATSAEITEAFSSHEGSVPYSSVNQDTYVGAGFSATPSNFSFTSELKMARERVLAALRKVDSGDVSVSQMQQMLFEMNIEPPDLFLTMLHVSSSYSDM